MRRQIFRFVAFRELMKVWLREDEHEERMVGRWAVCRCCRPLPAGRIRRRHLVVALNRVSLCLWSVDTQQCILQLELYQHPPDLA